MHLKIEIDYNELSTVISELLISSEKMEESFSKLREYGLEDIIHSRTKRMSDIKSIIEKLKQAEEVWQSKKWVLKSIWN